ncbi:hypothetical protein BX600DRAFT_35339 [Xylariales sp. PMI_506]|nr:hypothetical protein BX600DRAFT_35339 [Xylariales sp. PMI_506]
MSCFVWGVSWLCMNFGRRKTRSPSHLSRFLTLLPPYGCQVRSGNDGREKEETARSPAMWHVSSSVPRPWVMNVLSIAALGPLGKKGGCMYHIEVSGRRVICTSAQWDDFVCKSRKLGSGNRFGGSNHL